MSNLLNEYFESYAEAAIAKMKAALIAVDYYERIRVRLEKKEDLSGELAIIAKVGPAGTIAVVKEAIAEYKAQVAGVWELHPHLQEIGKHKIRLSVKEREHLPRAEVSYQFKSSAGTVNIRISTAGETFRLEINAGKNPMAAQMAYIELEKELTFTAEGVRIFV